MRYQAAEKLEIIRMVERSHLSVQWTMDQIGIPRATFYRWYDLYQTGGPGGVEDRPSRPGRIVRLALEEPELSPRDWPCVSPTPNAASCRGPAFTGF